MANTRPKARETAKGNLKIVQFSQAISTSCGRLTGNQPLNPPNTYKLKGKPMTETEQKALELVNADRAQHRCGPISVLEEYHVIPARILFRALEAHDADKARHAAELREQAERFSERDERLGEALYGLSARLLLDGWFEEKANHDAYEKVVAAFGKAFILAPVDPLVEAMSEAMCGVPGEDYTQPAKDLRAALDARGLAIVAKAPE